MAKSSFYKNQHCRVHTQKAENPVAFIALIVSALWLLALSILTWNVDVIHILF